MSIRNKVYAPSDEDWRRSMKLFIPGLLVRFFTPIVLAAIVYFAVRRLIVL